ncbi:hypothetical protein ACH50O_02850 [Methylomonas sp. 2BW1-5-20]|uniref:hypothetical protein n=1 Tax=Methylomonas sp. 2BW1-5-20 TaxID=3376686 RepID=UPI00404D1644
MSGEDALKVLFLSLAVAVVLIGFSVLVLAFKIGTGLISDAVIVIFQFLMSIAGVVMTGLAAGKAYESILKRVKILEYQYGELFTQINKRAPTFAASATLIASLVMLIADKAFKGELIPTVCVGVVLALLFWIANELMLAGTTTKYYLGVGTWLICLLILPAAMVVHHAGGFGATIDDIAKLGVTTIVLLGMAFIVACLAPIALKN